MPLSCSHLLEASVQLPLTEVCDFSDWALLFLNLLVGLSVPFCFQSPFSRMNLSLGQKQKLGPSHCGDAQDQTQFQAYGRHSAVTEMGVNSTAPCETLHILTVNKTTLALFYG